MNILVVDDEARARKMLLRLLSEIPGEYAAAEAANAAEAVAAIQDSAYDLVLLDIDLRDRSGFDVIEAVGPAVMPPVVFVTAYDEFAVRAFDSDAADYLLKPVTPSRLSRALDRVNGRVPQTRGAASAGMADDAGGIRWLAVRHGGEVRIVEVSEIERVEAAGNYVNIYVDSEPLLHRESVASLERRLPSDLFARIHRSAIVNISRINRLEPYVAGDYMVFLKSGAKVRLSRTHREAFMGRFHHGASGNA